MNTPTGPSIKQRAVEVIALVAFAALFGAIYGNLGGLLPELLGWFELYWIRRELTTQEFTHGIVDLVYWSHAHGATYAGLMEGAFFAVLAAPACQYWRRLYRPTRLALVSSGFGFVVFALVLGATWDLDRRPALQAAYSIFAVGALYLYGFLVGCCIRWLHRLLRLPPPGD